jgi:hypothetical protein
MIGMNKVGIPATYKGRKIGILVLVATQTFIGIIHSFFGIFLLVACSSDVLFPSISFSEIYSIYTLFYGLLTIISTYGLWMNNRWGWISTLSISIFVIIMDSLTILNMPIIPEIPKFAAMSEILYSLVVLLYIIQPKIQHIFLKTKNTHAIL